MPQVSQGPSGLDGVGAEVLPAQVAAETCAELRGAALALEATRIAPVAVAAWVENQAVFAGPVEPAFATAFQ